MLVIEEGRLRGDVNSFQAKIQLKIGYQIPPVWLSKPNPRTSISRNPSPLSGGQKSGGHVGAFFHWDKREAQWRGFGEGGDVRGRRLERDRSIEMVASGAGRSAGKTVRTVRVQGERGAWMAKIQKRNAAINELVNAGTPGLVTLSIVWNEIGLSRCNF